MLSYKGTIFKNHWIVWEDKLRLLNGDEVTMSTPLTEQVQLKLFTWGHVRCALRAKITLGDFLKYIYGGMVFSKIP